MIFQLTSLLWSKSTRTRRIFQSLPIPLLTLAPRTAQSQTTTPQDTPRNIFDVFHTVLIGQNWTLGDLLLILFFVLLSLLTIVVLRNSTLLKRRAAVIEEQSAELQFQKRALDQHAAVSLIDANGIFEYVNDNFLDVTGYERSEVIGQSGYLLWPESEGRAEYESLLETVYAGQVWSGEVPALKKDGTAFWSQATVVPYMDSKGNFIRSATVRTDITANKRLEAERQLSNSFDALGDTVVMLWPDTLEFLYLNTAALKRFGWETNRGHGKTFVDITPGFDEARFRRRVEMAKTAPNKQVDFEVRMSETRIDHVTLNYLTPAGEEPRVIIVMRDITEQVNSRNEILDLRAALDLADFEVFIIEPETLQYTYLNKSALQTVGWAEDEYKSRTPADDDDKFDEAVFRGRVAPLVSGETKVVTFERPSLNGRPTEVSIQYLELHDQGKRFVVVVRDISERKNSEREIRRFKHALDHSSDSIHMFWPDTQQFFYGNELARKRTEATVEEFAKMTPMDTNPNLTKDVLVKRLNDIVASDSKYMVYESVAKTETGALAPVEVNLQYIAPKGARPYFLANIRDLTEAKKAEKAKTEFVSTVSHELRTPLTSIKGSLGLVKAGALGPLTDKQTSMIEIAYNNCERLVLLINDILDLEKIEAGKMDYQMREVEAVPLLAECVASMQSYADQFDVTIENHTLLQNATINVDENRLVQVMTNLMSNAIKFSDPNEKVRVIAEDHQGALRITISDNGSGIPDDAKPTIFDKFTQADSSDVRRTGGTGLGLSITKNMVEHMQGSIHFTSTQGVGTDFWVEFPLISATPLIDHDPSQMPKRVLVVEDDLDYAKVIKKQLQESGFHVTISRNAAETLDLVKTYDFDAVTLDLGLPDADGMTLLSEIDSLKSTQTLPVVVITGASQNEETALPDTLAGVFYKPPNHQELVQLLRSLGQNSPNELPAVLHVEDDTSTREVLREVIGDLAQVNSVATLVQAKKAIKNQTFDLVILDIELPDGSGLDVLPTLQDAFDPNVPVIIFSANEPSAYDQGAITSVILKSQKTNEEILEEIKNVLQRKRGSARNNDKTAKNSSR